MLKEPSLFYGQDHYGFNLEELWINTRLIPGLGRSPRERNGNPLQCSCLEKPMDRGAWQAKTHRVAKSRLKWLSTYTRFHLEGAILGEERGGMSLGTTDRLLWVHGQCRPPHEALPLCLGEWWWVGGFASVPSPASWGCTVVFPWSFFRFWQPWEWFASSAAEQNIHRWSVSPPHLSRQSNDSALCSMRPQVPLLCPTSCSFHLWKPPSRRASCEQWCGPRSSHQVRGCLSWAT